MGGICQFECPACGYEAKVAGGPGGGFLFQTHTILCEVCRNLQDATCRTRPAKDVEEWNEHDLRCRRSRQHPVQLWEDGGPCPRCGTPMEMRGIVALVD